jgi:hypothetical protein
MDESLPTLGGKYTRPRFNGLPVSAHSPAHGALALDGSSFYRTGPSHAWRAGSGAGTGVLTKRGAGP